jgi:pseudaminic acid synthase
MSKREITIKTPSGDRKIGDGHPCFIIAEMSGNHNQNFDKALEIIREAGQAGADAIKIQTYTPDTMTIDSDKKWFLVSGKDQPDTWKGEKLYDLYKTAYTPWEWQADLKRETERLGMVFFSTPFDPTAVDFLEELGVEFYKIASYEATDFVLLRAVAQTGKPVIISTGFATEEEVDFAISTLRKYGTRDIVVLHCVTAYAGEPNIDEMNLSTMRAIGDKYDIVTGFSDNNGGSEVPTVAAVYGAAVIEKHFMIDRKEGGPDARFSVHPDEFKTMVDNIRRAERMIGKVNFGCQGEQESENIVFRRSLFVVSDIKKGEIISPENVRSIRPAAGLETKYYDDVMGKVAKKDIERGTPFSWNLVAE